MTVTDDIMNRVVELSSMTDEDYFNALYTNNPQAEARMGRPPAKHSNPLHVFNVWDETDFNDDDDVLWLDNILAGTIGCMMNDVKSSHKGDVISATKLLRLYKNMDSFMTDGIMRQLGCSKMHAGRYMMAIKLSNPFVSAYIMHQSGAIQG
jgi:hypothetical protein